MYFLQTTQNKFLSNFNALFSIVVIYGIIVLRSTSEMFLPSWVEQGNVLLPFIVYFGQRRSMAEGLTLTIITSHLYSLCSAAPIGLFVLLYLCVFLVARGVSYIIYASQIGSILVLLLLVSVLFQLLGIPVAAAFNHRWMPTLSWMSLFGLLANLVIGYFFYQLMALLDRLTYKTPAMKIEFSERQL